MATESEPDLTALREEHTAEAVQARLGRGGRRYLKGLEGEALKAVVDAVTADRELWVRTMLTEELGYAPTDRSPVRASLFTFLAFVVFGALPLLVFVAQSAADLEVDAPFAWSAALAGAAFFAVGTLKARFVDQAWWRAGLETLSLGGAAAGLAYLVGVILENV